MRRKILAGATALLLGIAAISGIARAQTDVRGKCDGRPSWLNPSICGFCEWGSVCGTCQISGCEPGDNG